MESTKLEIPIAIRWKISKDQLRSGLKNEKITSSLLKHEQLPGIEYCLAITTNPEKQINISLALSMSEAKPVNANFKVFIYSENIFYKMDSIFERSEMWGKEICSIEELFDPAWNYFINDFLIVSMEGVLSVEKEQQDICGGIEILNNQVLDECLWDGNDKDFDVHVEENVIKVHKKVIQKMFPSKIKESDQKKMSITDFDYDIVEIAMKYYYGKNIGNFLNVSNGIKLLHFASKYGIHNLTVSMEEYLFKKKSPMNVCEIVNASILSNSTKLRERCSDYLIQCMKKSIFVKDLDTLDHEFAMNLLKTAFSCK